MNRIQYRRWKDFAIRMSHNGWPPRQIKGKTHQTIVIPAVAEFFYTMEWSHSSDIIRMESWDDTRLDYSKRGYYKRPLIGPYVCDIVDEMMDSHNPFYYAGENCAKSCESWDDKWGGRIRCCIRAGMDIAVSQGEGVLGFTKADVDRMYPDGAPKWVRKEWGKENGEWQAVVWEHIPSTAGIWL